MLWMYDNVRTWVDDCLYPGVDFGLNGFAEVVFESSLEPMVAVEDVQAADLVELLWNCDLAGFDSPKSVFSAIASGPFWKFFFWFC